MELVVAWIASGIWGLGIGPAAYLLALRYRSQYRRVLLSWKNAPSMLLTLGVFSLNLALFTVSCLFFAAYVGRLNGWELLDLPSKSLLTLGSTSLLLLAGISWCYAALQLIYTQLVTEKGILLQRHPLPWMGKPWRELLPWPAIQDYYLQSDYPVSVYRFIVRLPGRAYERRSLRVPFYVGHRFEALLEQKLRREKEQRHQSLSDLRKTTGS